MRIDDHAARSIRAAWAIIAGRKTAMTELDLTPDGLWRSFSAIIISAPALAMGWLALTGEDMLLGPVPYPLWNIFTYAAGDLAAWTVPLLLFAIVSRPLGLADRFAAYVVATNWGSVIVAWLMAPAALLRFMLPGEQAVTPFLIFATFGFSLAAVWRLTHAALGKGALVTTAVFLAMFMAGMVVLQAVKMLTGV